MKGYSSNDVAAMLGLSADQVRAFVSSGVVVPVRGSRGEYRFSFQDLVLLRTAKELSATRISGRKLKKTLERLRQQLPVGRPLTAVRIAARGDRIVVQDGGTLWSPDSGQVLFDFAVSELASQVAPLARQAAQEARRDEEDLSGEDWYELGCELEFSAPDDARDAYQRAIDADPGLCDAYVNLGRLLHEEGDTAAAEALYRRALSHEPQNSTAAFNLGVALEDLGRDDEAGAAYRNAIDQEPSYADAHYNLAGVYERRGAGADALKHLKMYRKLVKA